MSSHMISIYVLAAMFVLATVLPINMGIIAFVGAFLVGTLFAGMSTKAIMAGFPAELFLTLVGITYLFALAQNNGTIDWLVRLAVRMVRGHVAAIPWVMFFITAVLTGVGAVSPGAVAIVAPIALGFAAKYQISPLLMGMMVVHGAQGGGFSPISIYGGITNRVVEKAGLPLSEMTTALASLGVNLAVAAILFVTLGGMRLLRHPVVPPERRSVIRTAPVAIAQRGPQVFGDVEDEAEIQSGAASDGATPTVGRDGTLEQWAMVTGLILLAVLTLYFRLDIGFVAITIGLVLTLFSPNLQKRAIGQVSWPEIMLIVGVSTYVAVLEKMGTIDFVGHSVAGLTSPLIAALLLCFIGAVVSAFASSTAVLGSLIPLAVPFLQQGTGVSAIGFIAAMAIASTIVDVSPFSTNGALVLANAQGIDRQVFLRQLMIYGGIITLVAPVVVWVLFVVW